MKAYIISFYQQEISDDELMAFLKTKSGVLNLMRPLPNTIFIVSDRNASSLAKIIEKKFPKGFFIIAEYVPYNSDGSLIGEMWDFLNKPKRARKTNTSARKKKSVARGRSASERK
jgi:hypothetical protein